MWKGSVKNYWFYPQTSKFSGKNFVRLSMPLISRNKLWCFRKGFFVASQCDLISLFVLIIACIIDSCSYRWRRTSASVSLIKTWNYKLFLSCITYMTRARNTLHCLAYTTDDDSWICVVEAYSSKNYFGFIFPPLTSFVLNWLSNIALIFIPRVVCMTLIDVGEGYASVSCPSWFAFSHDTCPSIEGKPMTLVPALQPWRLSQH